ncbi:MAG: hypothetical protein R6V08_06605 [Desulfuromonadales bacterium]
MPKAPALPTGKTARPLKHAMEMGLGTPKEKIRLRIAAGDQDFKALMGQVRESTGL